MVQNKLNQKIGVITHYFDSRNYGGNFQAYALVKILKKNGFNAEQICYDRNNKLVYNEKVIRKLIKKLLYATVLRHRGKQVKEYRDWLEKRKVAFQYFNNNIINHSEKIYDDETIKNCCNYDVFITGSDQVWNLAWYYPAYFLNFVSPKKKKISYAASISMDELNDEQKEIFKNHLGDFNAISVREPSSIELIKDLSPVKVEHALDPTLLLDVEDWNEIREEYNVNEKYVFCYFLGDNTKERDLAKKFSREKGVKLIGVPMTFNDVRFGGEKLFGVSPQQFLSLIANAEYVFTDSFHAVVFSTIYKKQYFVFNRNSRGEMSSRIRDITNLFNTCERFCTGEERENLNYLNSLQDIDYNIKNNKFEELKQKSIEFLINNING